MSYTEQYLNLLKNFYQKVPNDNNLLGFEIVAEKIGYVFPRLSSRTSSEVCDYIEEQIKNVLTTTSHDFIKTDSLYAIINQLEINKALSKDDNFNGYNDLKYIAGLLKESKIIPFANDVAWEKALLLVYYRNKMIPSEPPYWPSSRNLRIADCILFFKNRGWTYSCEDGSLELENEISFLKLIDDSILDIGILNILNWIFKELTYNSTTSMFVIKRISDHIFSKESQIPYGFILNRVLCLASKEKIFKNKVFVSKKIEKFKEIALYLTSYLDVLPHNIYEAMMPISLDFEVLGRWVAYDWLVDFLQYPYQEMDDFICFLSKNEELNVFAKNVFGYSLTDYFDAIQDIQIAANEKDITILNPQNISHDCSCELLIKIMDNNASNVNDVNKKFTTYKDITSIDYYFSPFIKIGTNQYLLLPKSLMSIGLYESVATKYRNAGFNAKNGNDFDSYVGSLVETFVMNKCIEFGRRSEMTQIEVYANEKYQISHKDQNSLNLEATSGECDLIMATKQNIYFIECKKKNLCRKSYNGHAVNAYVDLSQSFFASQKQALRHEILLKKNGKILFDSGKEIVLNGRKIVRISLTTFDFKSLQSKIISQNILINSINKMFTSENRDFSRDLSKINKAFEEVTCLIENGQKCNVIGDRYFHNICWLNVFQLAFILEKCKDSCSLDKVISSLLHMSYGYYNNWNELLITDCMYSIFR